MYVHVYIYIERNNKIATCKQSTALIGLYGFGFLFGFIVRFYLIIGTRYLASLFFNYLEFAAYYCRMNIYFI